ncbi:hypothetical protein GWI33_017580 [Rhynchophorus ferrugineus]|uniref:Uncharacterized protein n=1 Tax=Rhynchophorus ferrugineus TaxID=354439 RepID=A0A834I929_RHYFE|nr:hypothetical protein GWI33_017580 [Rhynchophorus ferrugineus]
MKTDRKPNRTDSQPARLSVVVRFPDRKTVHYAISSPVSFDGFTPHINMAKHILRLKGLECVVRAARTNVPTRTVLLYRTCVL